MTATTEPTPPRIVTLDIVRGVAVMGILAMNIIAFSMPFQAYTNPVVYGMETTADFVSWLFSFVFVDGKMRGLFSFLFGASMLLVIERAEAEGQSARSVHFRRMFWLLVFGLLHFYLLWFGDILTQYAVIGMLAWLFRKKPARSLVKWGVGLVAFQFLLMALIAVSMLALAAAAGAPGADPEAVQTWAQMKTEFGAASPQQINEIVQIHRSGYGDILAYRFVEFAIIPLMQLFFMGVETLAYMLFGMAAFRSGLLTGTWPARSYHRAALAGFGIAVPAYALLAWILVSRDFSMEAVVAVNMAATVPFRPVMVLGYAALIVLLTARGGGLVDRIAAAGRAAFTNYLGTTIVMTTLFYGYGFGLFGTMGRAELWIPMIAMWGLMLLWSKPWLDRYRYGPFEWLWRSLSRGKAQPMRKRVEAPTAA